MTSAKTQPGAIPAQPGAASNCLITRAACLPNGCSDCNFTAAGPAPAKLTPGYPGPLSTAPESQWSEDRLQQECLYWLQFAHPTAARLIFHVPNGGLRTAKQAGDFRAMGVKAGVPDLCLPIPQPAWPKRSCCALFIEMKTPTGRLERAQEAYHIELRNQGNRVEVVRSLAEFQSLLTEYLA